MHGGDTKPQGQEKLIIWLLLALILSKYASCSIKDNWIPVILHLENDIDSSEHVSSLFGNNNLNGKSAPLTQVKVSYGLTLVLNVYLHVINSSSKLWYIFNILRDIRRLNYIPDMAMSKIVCFSTKMQYSRQIRRISWILGL